MEKSSSTALCLRRLTAEEALNEIGLGRFQYLLLFVLGLTWTADVAEIVLLAFLAPAAKCEWDLSTAEESLISGIVFLGMAMGSYLCGAISDAAGRKVGLITCITILSVSGLATTFVPNYMWLVIARGVVGIGIGGMNSTLGMFSEFLPQTHRGSILSYMECFASLGTIVEALLAWILLPSLGWRALVLASSAIPLLLIFLLPLVPESPRYFIVSGQQYRAQMVLKTIATINGKDCPDGELYVVEVNMNTAEGTFSKFMRQFFELFQIPLNRITPVVWFMSFCTGLGYYSALLLVTKIGSDHDEEECTDDEVSFTDADYLSILLSGVGEMTCSLVVLLVIDKYQRRRLFLVLYWLYSFLVFPLVFSPPWKQGFLIIARPVMTGSFILISVIAAEVYPSSCRASASGMANIASRISGGLSPFISLTLYDTYGLQVVAGLFSFFFFFAGMSSFLLPFDTLDTPMFDTVSDILNFVTREDQGANNPLIAS